MTESTELLAFKRQKDGYKVIVKSYLCTCVVLSWDELKVRQNLLANDYEIYIVCLLVATVYWHKSLHFVKKSNMTLLPFYLSLYRILARFNLQFVNLAHIIILVAWQAWQINSKTNQPPNYQEMGFFPSFHIYKNLPRITVFRKLKRSDPSMIPLPAEVRECLQKSMRVTSYILI